MTGDVLSVDPAILGTSVLQEQNCVTDFIQIPTSFQQVNGVWTRLANDRFCGLGFASILSGWFIEVIRKILINFFLGQNLSPFTIRVVTDSNETPDIANRGFFLSYKQLATCVT